jgi:alpha-galactosidase
MMPGTKIEEVVKFINREKPVADFMLNGCSDHATDMIECMVEGKSKQFYINTYNQGAVSNMADDAFLELLCDLDMNGPRPVSVSDIPRGIRGMQELVLDTHELTAKAVCDGSYELLRRAIMTDPLVCSITDADAIIKELLEAEKDIIPAGWYK